MFINSSDNIFLMRTNYKTYNYIKNHPNNIVCDENNQQIKILKKLKITKKVSYK